MSYEEVIAEACQILSIPAEKFKLLEPESAQEISSKIKMK